MDGNNRRAVEGQVQIPGQVMVGEAVAATGMKNGDWRAQIEPGRERIVNKIFETLKRHLPFTGQEGLKELKKIAVRFEEKTCTAAISQSDYLRKISLKMVTMELSYQKHSGASQSMLPRMQNNIGSTGVPNSAGSMAALPAVASMPQGTVVYVPAQNQVQQMQGVPSNIYANARRQIQGRQQEGVNQPARELTNRHIKTRARLPIDPEVEKAQLELKKARLEFEEARVTWTAKFQL